MEAINKCAVCQYSQPDPHGGWVCKSSAYYCSFEPAKGLATFLKEVKKNG